jgi:8-oxo-dGTP pyrophosphatase MutT (NUDIX family)
MTDPLAYKTASNLKLVYAKEPYPEAVTKTIFLAGPTPRSKEVASWRPEALGLLAALGFDGHVFIPEPRDGNWSGDYADQVEWEEEGLNRADIILFWVPRKMDGMPALTTNIEWGVWADSGKAILGSPADAEKNRYLLLAASKLHVPTASTLRDTCAAAVTRIGAGADRRGGEACVPLQVWKHATFQAWYESQKAASNRLDGARVLWTFGVGPKNSILFSWAVKVDVYISEEGRNKTNEYVFGRSDISCIALFWRPSKEQTGPDKLSFYYDSEFVLVKEFRSPARTPDGYIYELPGGSSKEDIEDTKKLAIKELEEETSFTLNPARLIPVGALQVAGTLSAHKASLFIARITTEERDQIKAIADKGEALGVEEDTERTFVQVLRLRDLMEKDMVDWMTLGMIQLALMNDPGDPEAKQETT